MAVLFSLHLKMKDGSVASVGSGFKRTNSTFLTARLWTLLKDSNQHEPTIQHSVTRPGSQDSEVAASRHALP